MRKLSEALRIAQEIEVERQRLIESGEIRLRPLDEEDEEQQEQQRRAIQRQ